LQKIWNRKLKNGFCFNTHSIRQQMLLLNLKFNLFISFFTNLFLKLSKSSTKNPKKVHELVILNEPDNHKSPFCMINLNSNLELSLNLNLNCITSSFPEPLVTFRSHYTHYTTSLVSLGSLNKSFELYSISQVLSKDHIYNPTVLIPIQREPSYTPHLSCYKCLNIFVEEIIYNDSEIRPAYKKIDQCKSLNNVKLHFRLKSKLRSKRKLKLNWLVHQIFGKNIRNKNNVRKL
jgi:hypothetical protein